MAPRCVNYRSAQSIREIIHDSEKRRVAIDGPSYFPERLSARQCPPMNDSRPECWIYRWWGRWRDWTSSTSNIYVSSDEPGLFPSLCNCSSHRRVLLLLLFFPLLLRLPLRASRLTATTVINWWASRHAAYLLRFFLSLFLLANRPTFVNSIVLLRRPRRWRRRRQWLPASSYFSPDSGFPATGASIRRPNATVTAR